MTLSSMASMMDLPREGHLNVVFQMFLFLKSKHNGVTVFDPTDPEIYQTQFQLKIGLQHLMIPERRMFF